MMQPRLYVVDEPLANLDPATAERLLRAAPGPGRRGPRGRDRRAPRRGGARAPAGSGPVPRRGPARATSARSSGFLEVADPRRSSCRSRWCSRASARAGVGWTAGRRQRPERATTALAGPTTAGDGHRRGSSTATSAPAMASARSSAASTRPSAGARPSPSSARTARARRRCSGPRCASWRPTAGEILVEGRPIRRAHRSAARHRLRLRLPEPEPDAVRPDRPRGAPVRATEPQPAAGDLRRPRRRRAPPDVAGHARRDPRAAAADAFVRPAEAAGPRDRPRPPAAGPDPRRTVSRPGPPHGEPLSRRGRNHRRTSKASI